MYRMGFVDCFSEIPGKLLYQLALHKLNVVDGIQSWRMKFEALHLGRYEREHRHEKKGISKEWQCSLVFATPAKILGQRTLNLAS